VGGDVAPFSRTWSGPDHEQAADRGPGRVHASVHQRSRRHGPVLEPDVLPRGAARHRGALRTADARGGPAPPSSATSPPPPPSSNQPAAGTSRPRPMSALRCPGGERSASPRRRPALHPMGASDRARPRGARRGRDHALAGMDGLVVLFPAHVTRCWARPDIAYLPVTDLEPLPSGPGVAWLYADSRCPDGQVSGGVAVVGADPDHYERSKGAGEWPSQIWRDACSG
jgi:hypothetical protein